MSQNEKITSDFLSMVDTYLEDLRQGRADQRLSTADFGRRLFIHPRHLTNTVKLVTGKSPCDFIEERLAEEAQRMLRETSLSVADIGARLAYPDPSNFTKFFKIMTGMTPRQYRALSTRPD
jgi:AraC family transcriptional regulator of adaptative response / methylphosphotriester-DNA alkyltransferase methyltransferase